MSNTLRQFFGGFVIDEVIRRTMQEEERRLVQRGSERDRVLNGRVDELEQLIHQQRGDRENLERRQEMVERDLDQVTAPRRELRN